MDKNNTISVLLIDDDEKLQEAMSEYLTNYNINVFSHFSGNGVLPVISEAMPNLIILDIMLPGKDGLDVLREIRKTIDIPVLMLTARGEDTDRIIGLELGADDYLSKPFNPRELLARIKAILRRSQGPKNKGSNGDVIKEANLILNKKTYVLSYNEDSIELSTTEFKILEALMENPNDVLSRDDIMNRAKGRDFMAFERSIDVHVSKLRSKVADLTGSRDLIKTVWGTGYMFVIPD